MRTLIKNGTVVTAVDQYKGDVLIEDQKISLIGTSLDMQADRTIDASGKYVLPGGIDVHTHLDMPFGGTTSTDDFETGTTAAAFGGTTSIVDFAIQYRGQTLHHAMETWAQKADGKAAREFAKHATASMVGVNIGVAAPMAYFPFGGAKDSFFGDLKAHGRDGIEFYTDKKVTISRWF